VDPVLRLKNDKKLKKDFFVDPVLRLKNEKNEKMTFCGSRPAIKK
jgi:hypothetical protein